MGNIYDIAYNIENELRSHEDFKKLIVLSEKLNENTENKELLESFREVQLKVQKFHLAKEEIDDELKKECDDMILEIHQNPLLSEYLMIEERVFLMINDITKIIVKPLEDLKK